MRNAELSGTSLDGRGSDERTDETGENSVTPYARVSLAHLYASERLEARRTGEYSSRVESAARIDGGIFTEGTFCTQ